MYDDGVLYVCDLVDLHDNGDKPKQVLTKVNKYWFSRRTIGINRQYLAKGVNERIDMLVRIKGLQNISIGQNIILGNGDQYRIVMVSTGHEENEYTRMVNQKYYKTARIVGLDYTEISMQKLEKYYDVRTIQD